jgi:CHAD domain-containing protein
LDFLAPPQLATDAIVSLVGASWRLAEEPARLAGRAFYDTFDWSLWTDGGILERRQEAGEAELIWTALDRDSEPLSQPSSEEPAFAEDLPPGPVRARILKPTGIRRVLPVMRIQTRERILRLLDDEDKTVARIAMEESRFQDPVGGGEGHLPVRVRVLPVRGYDTERDSALGLLSDDLGLEPAQSPAVLDALAAAGRRPGDYSSKIDFTLDPDARADGVTKSILRGLLDTIERNVPGTRANLDSEFLHDLRVAVRRTRSALTQIRDVFPDPIVAHYKERFAWLQQVTGPVRDLDVYLLDFDDYQQSLPEPLGLHLEPLRAFLLSHYDEEQRRLASALTSPEFADLISDWHAFLESPVPQNPEAADAGQPIKALADARIWRMAKRVRREGRAITPQSPAEDMHELRKSCKKLRYLMEFFQSLYPGDAIRALIKLLKVLLDNLGSFQDIAVQAGHLQELAVRMRAEDKADTDTLLAMGALIGDLLARQRRAREQFAEVFTGFLVDETQRQIRALFRPSPDGRDDQAAGEEAAT